MGNGAAMTRKGRHAGYTLLELMVVIAIMGMMAMMVGPALGSWRNDTRHQDAAYGVLKMFEQAQNAAVSSGDAQVLRLSAGTNGHGLLEILPGMNHSCLKTPWLLIPAPGADPNVARFDVDWMNPAGASRTLTLTLDIGGGDSSTGVLCLEPSGRSYTGAVVTAMTPQTDLAIFRITGTDSSGNVSGATRMVLGEPGGRARIQR